MKIVTFCDCDDCYDDTGATIFFESGDLGGAIRENHDEKEFSTQHPARARDVLRRFVNRSLQHAFSLKASPLAVQLKIPACAPLQN
jgi:hypothetical protein